MSTFLLNRLLSVLYALLFFLAVYSFGLLVSLLRSGAVTDLLNWLASSPIWQAAISSYSLAS